MYIYIYIYIYIYTHDINDVQFPSAPECVAITTMITYSKTIDTNDNNNSSHNNNNDNSS